MTNAFDQDDDDIRSAVVHYRPASIWDRHTTRRLSGVVQQWTFLSTLYTHLERAYIYICANVTPVLDIDEKAFNLRTSVLLLPRRPKNERFRESEFRDDQVVRCWHKYQRIRSTGQCSNNIGPTCDWSASQSRNVLILSSQRHNLRA